ncbi:hypothetical protein [Pseudomonas sp. 31 R 17]|nr:hypothetical protein [Pseudomonas sp. 31 R 17]
MCFAQAGQAKQAIERLAQVAHGLVRRDEGQARTLDRLLAVQPPQAIAQGQCIDLLQHGGKPVAHAIGLAQQARAAPHQFLEIIGRHAEADHLCIQCQFLRRALQQFQQGVGGTGTAQRLAEVGLTQGAGQQLQQAQVFIGFGGNPDRQVHDLAVAPVHAFGKLQQTHAGGKHLVAGFRGAVRNGDALAKKGRALGFTGLQATEITFGNQAIGHQFFREQVQGRRFIHRHLAHGYLLYSELEHAVLLVSAGCALGIVLNKSA